MVKTAHQMGSAMMTTPAPGILLLRVPASSDPDAFRHFEGQINRALASRPHVVVVDLSEAQSVSTIMPGRLHFNPIMRGPPSQESDGFIRG